MKTGRCGKGTMLYIKVYDDHIQYSGVQIGKGKSECQAKKSVKRTERGVKDEKKNTLSEKIYEAFDITLR